MEPFSEVQEEHNFFIALRTKQSCKEKYKQAGRNSLHLRAWGHPGSRECHPWLTGVRHVPVHLPVVKRFAVPSAEQRWRMLL